MSGARRRALAGVRREPPPFRHVTVHELVALSPRMLRVTFGGGQLAGLEVNEPAASVRLLVPSAGAGLVIPTWNGNEFLLDDGSRPIIRTFTPLHLDGTAHTIDLDVVRHPGGAVSSWVESVQRGAEAAISGPGRGYSIDPGASFYLLAGDETALPAIGQLVRAIPASTHVHVIVEVVQADAQLDLPPHPQLTSDWVVLEPGAAPGAALLPAIEHAVIPAGSKLWVAGEAAAMHRVRRHLFDDRSLARSDATVRGYWKHGR